MRREKALDKFWELQTINLARQPQDQHGVTRMNAEFDRVINHLKNELRLSGLKTESPQEDDGIMKVME